MIYEATVEIERPISEVFEAATCMRRCMGWMNPISHSQMDSDEPAHVGSTFSGNPVLFGVTYQLNAAISELDPPYRLAFKSLHPPTLTGHYIFTPTERGTTFRLTVEGGQIVTAFEDSSLQKAAIDGQFQQSLEQLKILMENEVDLWTLLPPSPQK